MIVPFTASTRIVRMAVVACASLALGACCCGVVDTTEEAGPAVCREPAISLPVAALHDSLLVIVPSPQLDTAQERRLDLARAQPTAARVVVARIAANATELLQPGKQVVVSVSATRSFAVTGQTYNEGLGSRSWMGRIQGENGEVTLVHSFEGITGGLQTAPMDGSTWSVYSFHPIGGGLHAVICVDPSKFPPD